MSTLTEEQMATLSPEEQAAITDTEYSPEELAAMQGIITEDGVLVPDDDTDPGIDPVPADPNIPALAPATVKTPDPAPVPPVVADPAPDAMPEPAIPTAKQAPVYQAPAVEDYDNKIKTIADQETALKEQFKDGSIDFDEYSAQQSKLIHDRTALDRQQTKSEIAVEMTAQNQDQLWKSTVSNSLARYAKEDGGIDYHKDADKAGDLDQIVKVLAANPANADRSMEWFMDEGHKRVKALHGLATAPAPTPKETVAEAVAKRTPPVTAVPKTLAHVPGADGPGDIESEFANLDTLEGEALEGAIAKMSAAQRERYARS